MTIHKEGKELLYSLKMRSSKGGVHGKGGRHISGAERIIPENLVEEEVLSMVRRARKHDRGSADFIQLKIEAVRPEDITCCPMLSIRENKTAAKEEGLAVAKRELLRAGVSEKAAERGIDFLTGLSDSMRGAVVMDAETGERLDGKGERGVRCSNMDCEDKESYERDMKDRGLSGEHPREALVLASKVAYAPGTAAELCWSDDPEYVTGYVGSATYGYQRITVMKDLGDPVGGRIFFVKPGTDVEKYIDYMQNQVVLVRLVNENK